MKAANWWLLKRERVPGRQLERRVEERDAQGVEAPRGPDVGGERGETADRAGVVSLAADGERGRRDRDGRHVRAIALGATRSGGPAGQSRDLLAAGR